MNVVKKIVKRFLNHSQNNDVVTIYPKTNNIRGRVLFSYLPFALLVKDEDPIFNSHSNVWESREIARVFTRLGYVVDAISYGNHSFLPVQDYDIVFDIDINLQRLMPFLKKDCIKILHMTGSYSRFQNQAEMKRVQDLERRKNVFYTPKRLDSFLELVDRSLNFSDKISLLGNDFVLNTFPKNIKDKMVKVPVSASKLNFVKESRTYVSNEREFLWYFGGGAVHKGLDLVLDVFLKNKDLKLNIVGNVKSEKDFWQVFEKELTDTPNIFYHGHLHPSSIEFETIIKKVFCFIAPSCSEGISPSVATCLQLGLFPIISRNTGVDLPRENGIYLENCSIDEIEKVVSDAYAMPRKDIEDQISECQKYALQKFSRDNFSKEMTSFIVETIR